MATLKFDNTLGAVLISSILSMALWGIACVQAHCYFLDNNDGVPQRLVVVLLLAVDTLSSAMISHISYYYMVTNYANPFSLLTRTWSLNLISAVSGVITFIIRTMFAHRVYQFSGKNKTITIWIMTLTIGDFVSAVMLSAKCLSSATSLDIQRLKLMYISVALGLSADLSVAVALSWLLHSAKTGFRRSDSIVNTLIVYIVNTGLLVTLGAAVGMVVYVAIPAFNMIPYAVFAVDNKLYVNAYLASLNSRSRLRATDPKLNSSYPLFSLASKRTTMPASDKTSFGSLAVAISLETTVERIVD